MPQQPPPRAAQDQHHCHCSCPSPLFNRMREHDTDTSTRPLNSMMTPYCTAQLPILGLTVRTNSTPGSGWSSGLLMMMRGSSTSSYTMQATAPAAST